MSNTQKVVLGAIAIVIVVIATITLASRSNGPVATPASSSEEGLGASSGYPVNNTTQGFYGGVDLGGGYVTFSKGGVISTGQNQGSWRNTTGRVVYILPEQSSIGYQTGTASSSLLFYSATSSASTLSNDYAHPGGLVFGVDGATVATSTAGPRMFVGTTTNSGAVIPVADGQYYVFQIQDRYACKAVGVCETATSTNRGITNFIWRLQGFYKP